MHKLTAEEVQRLLVTAKGHRLEALFTLALTTAMRRGELLALQWSDLDWQTGSLHIQRSVHLLAQVSAPKTGERTIVLPSYALEVLREHRMRQDVERPHAGTGWTEQNLIFSTSSGHVLSPQQIASDFQELLQEAHLPCIRFHDLRLRVGHSLLKKEKGQD